MRGLKLAGGARRDCDLELFYDLLLQIATSKIACGSPNVCDNQLGVGRWDARYPY